MLSVKPDRPVDSLTVAVMREVHSLLREMKLNYFVCGAVARDIVLRHVHGIETGTATADVDFGVAVENWEQFEGIKSRLIETRSFEPAKKMTQRLYYIPGTNRKGYPLDIIPFGKVESPRNSIAWPPDGNEVIAKSETLAKALVVLNDPELANRLVTHMAARFLHADDAIAEAESLLDKFKEGLHGG